MNIEASFGTEKAAALRLRSGQASRGTPEETTPCEGRRPATGTQV